MPDTAKAPGRAVVLVGFLVVAAIALRGSLPGAERAARRESEGGSGSLFVVAALLGVSLVILAFSFVVHLRQRRRPRPAPSRLPISYLGGDRRLRWRYLLIALAVVAAWLLIVALLARLGTAILPDDPGVQTSPEAPPADGPVPPTRTADPVVPTRSDDTVFRLLAAATVVMVLLSAAATLIAARRRRSGADGSAPDDSREPGSDGVGPGSLARAAEVGLAEIGDVSREPREAIIACYAAMEGELARVPDAVPQDFDTPTEVLARAVEHHALRGESASQLVDLFGEARFSRHVMTEEHREVAVRVLRLVLAELRSAA